ncbi:MAG: Flp pilus assembly protein CpaB [Candidatus Omnitrophota bacterium]
MRKKLPLIIGIVLALVAAYLIKVYTDQQRQLIIEDARKKIEKIRTEQVPILIAAKDIPKGAVIDKESVGVAIAPIQHVQPQAATSLDRVAGMIAVVPLSKGEQITLNKLMSSKEAVGTGSLAMTTPIGKRAVTISVDNISAVGGMILPGDYIDVSVMISVPVTNPDGKQVSQQAVVPLFQNILVLAVGQELAAMPEVAAEGRYAKKGSKREFSPAITLALSPQEANVLAFVQEQGKIRLSLRSPSDAKIESVQPASWDSLFQYLMPKEELEAQARQRQKKPEEPAPEPESYVEVYRGLNKEKVPLFK